MDRDHHQRAVAARGADVLEPGVGGKADPSRSLRQEPCAGELVESLERAAEDPKVGGVLVRVSSLPASGWGQVQELRNAITRFRASGKPAYAHLEFCGNKEYYLATACNKVYAVPTALPSGA